MAGERTHDFGLVDFTAEKLSLNHTFSIENRTARTIRIMGYGSDCACTIAEPSRTTVGPGQSVEVAVLLNLAQTGRRNSRCWLYLENGESIDFKVTAAAMAPEQFDLSHRSVLLGPESAARVTVVAVSRNADSQPMIVEAQVPKGVTAEFLGWQRIMARDASKVRPSVWHGIVQISLAVEAADVHEPLVLCVGPSWRAGVRLDGDPWR